MHEFKRDVVKYINLAGGFSEVTTDGNTVFKKIFAGGDLEKASRKFIKMKQEYLFIKTYLGNHALETDLSLEFTNSKYSILLQQKYLKGIPIRDSINGYNCNQRNFFLNCLNLYDNENIIPDLIPDIMPDPTLGRLLTGKYTYRSGPNVYLVNGFPILIDTTLNRGLRNHATAPIFNHLIASRIREILGII